VGFKARRTITLEFEGAMEGAEVTLLAASVDTMLQLRELSMDKAADLLAEHLASWNLEDARGAVLPLDADTIRREVEPGMVRQIVSEWYKVAIGVTAPLDPPSDDGPAQPATEAEVPSMPMEAL
jgi:hypothetical protein